MDTLYAFLMELDKLKSVYRRSYLSDLSRHENSAEHSWHIAIAMLAMKEEFRIDIDIIKSVKMALIHDICEIGAGDISVFDPNRSKKETLERNYLNELSNEPLVIASEIKMLWEEYESQSTKESHWVKVVDRLLPFMMNLQTEGKAWKEQGVSRSQVLNINQVVASTAPEVYTWMLGKIDIAISNGWLMNE